MEISKEISGISLQAKEQLQMGNYEGALEMLKEFWDPESKMIVGIDGLTTAENKCCDLSELGLRIGETISYLGQSSKINEPQNVARDLLFIARERFIDMGMIPKVVEAENRICATYLRTGELEEARIWCEEAIRRSIEELHDEHMYSLVLQGALLLTTPKSEWADRLFSNTEKSISSCSNCFLRGCFATNFGLYLNLSGRYLEAIDQFQHARTCYLESGHKRFLGHIENNLAQVSLACGEFEEAHLAVNRGIAVFEEVKDSNCLGSALDTKSSIFLAERNFEEALLCAESAIDYLRSSENPLLLADALLSKSKIFLHKNDLIKAEALLDESIEIAMHASGDEYAIKLVSDFEDAKKRKEIADGTRVASRTTLIDDEIELSLPGSLSHYDSYEVIRIRNNHLNKIGIPKGTLAVVVVDTIKRGDLVAMIETRTKGIICGFYDYFAGIMSIAGADAEALLYRTEEARVIGKIVGVAIQENEKTGKIPVKEIVFS